jgi:hypothetical protein
MKAGIFLQEIAEEAEGCEIHLCLTCYLLFNFSGRVVMRGRPASPEAGYIIES